MVRRGERSARAREAFLITSGEAEALLHNPSATEADASGNVHLCTRRAGNFVGALQLHYDGGDTLRGCPSPPQSPAAVVPSCSLSVSAGGSSCTLSASGPVPWGASGWSATSPSRGAWPEDVVACGADATGRQLRTVFMVLRAARRWVGHRRTISVRAVSRVTAIVLSHEDMRWAVAHDYRMSGELMGALKARKLSVVQAIRAEKLAAKLTNVQVGVDRLVGHMKS
jgi:hypothetical protein